MLKQAVRIVTTGLYVVMSIIRQASRFDPPYTNTVEVVSYGNTAEFQQHEMAKR
jgi:hypothetical protein